MVAGRPALRLQGLLLEIRALVLLMMMVGVMIECLSLTMDVLLMVMMMIRMAQTRRPALRATAVAGRGRRNGIRTR